MDGPSVLCVVVAHPSGSLVAETIRSLEAQTFQSLEVIVVKLGAVSVPDSRNVREVVEGADNVGFARGVHLGLQQLVARERYLLLLHDDVVLAPDTVERMVELAGSDETIGAVGAKLVEMDAPDVLQEVGAGIDHFAVRRSALDSGELDQGQRDTTTDALMCSDACLLVRTDAFVELGGLDPRAWPLYEDIDLCWKIRASGRRVVVATNTAVRHAAALSRGRRGFDDLSIAQAVERGRLRFVLKYFSVVGLAVLLPQLFVTAAARLAASALRREFWKVRSMLSAWTGVTRELPALRRARKRVPKVVDDRTLLMIGARSAAAERRHERAEWLADASEGMSRRLERVAAMAREPVTWATVIATIVVALILRDVLFGATFTLGELRAIPTFADALENHFASIRRSGLDPFAPAGPGLLAVSAIRSIFVRPALAEKITLLLPLVGAVFGGIRIARVLGLNKKAGRWIAVGAAANPITFVLLRDGSLGALVTWTASLYLVGALLSPAEVSAVGQERLRFYARWALGWSLIVALHPPALIWLLALGAAIIAARRDDGRTQPRARALLAGTIGSFVLLAPWSFEWLTSRTPLVGRPDWLVLSGASGLSTATLGAGVPLLGVLVVAIGGAYLVGLTRTTLMFSLLTAAAIAAGAGGVMPRETMLVGAGVCAFVLIASASRRIADELPSYELGFRHGLLLTGVALLAGMWLASGVAHVAVGTRSRDVPFISSDVSSGRVLWLSETTGGLRSWSTLNFARQLGAFPPASGTAERLAAEAVEAARTDRTHRAGSVLALADISHVVVLDAQANRGLDEQADLAPVEQHGAAVVYRNDAWKGPVVALPATPSEPLTARGLADVVRSPQRVKVRGWPFGPISFDAPDDRDGVVYVAGGARGGWDIEDAKGKIAAAGMSIDARALRGTVSLDPPGRFPGIISLEVLLIMVLSVAWFVASYFSRPHPVSPHVFDPGPPIDAGGSLLVPAVGVLAGLALGWSGVALTAGGTFLSAAWYCPPVGDGFNQSIAIANANPADVEYVVRSELSAKPRAEGAVRRMSRETVTVESDQGAVVESFGREIAVGSQVNSGGNRDSSLCSSGARTTNLFPEGGRASLRARPRLFERYIIYNPFADLARASVRFIPVDERPIAPPPLQDVQVKPGTYLVIDPEEQFEPMFDLSTVVSVWQGRAIVARRLQTVEQVSWSLGARVNTGGVMPRAVTHDATTAVIALNPSDEVAHVTLKGSGGRGSLPEQRFDVPPSGRTTFELNAFAPDSRGLVVALSADRPVSMETLVAPEARETVSLLPPLEPGRRWVMPIAETRELVIVNPSARAIRFDVDRLGPGGAIRSRRLGANRMAIVSLSGTQPFGLQVTADGPVTAAVIGARGSMPGVPIRS